MSGHWKRDWRAWRAPDISSRSKKKTFTSSRMMPHAAWTLPFMWKSWANNASRWSVAAASSAARWESRTRFLISWIVKSYLRPRSKEDRRAWNWQSVWRKKVFSVLVDHWLFRFLIYFYDRCSQGPLRDPSFNSGAKV